MLFIQRVKILFVMLLLSVIVAETRPNNDPYPQNEDFRIDEIPSPFSDKPMNADSFPMAPDVQDAPRMKGVHYNHQIVTLENY